jgi:hypothetical protein
VKALLPGSLQPDYGVGVLVRRKALKDGEAEVSGIAVPQ